MPSTNHMTRTGSISVLVQVMSAFMRLISGVLKPRINRFSSCIHWLCHIVEIRARTDIQSSQAHGGAVLYRAIERPISHSALLIKTLCLAVYVPIAQHTTETKHKSEIVLSCLGRRSPRDIISYLFRLTRPSIYCLASIPMPSANPHPLDAPALLPQLAPGTLTAGAT